jgi:hypothetical protein
MIGQNFVDFEKYMNLYNMYFTLEIGHFDNWSRGHITSVWPKYDYVCESYKKSITEA